MPFTFKYNVLSDVQQRLLIDRNGKKTGLTETEAAIRGMQQTWCSTGDACDLAGLCLNRQ